MSREAPRSLCVLLLHQALPTGVTTTHTHTHTHTHTQKNPKHIHPTFLTHTLTAHDTQPTTLIPQHTHTAHTHTHPHHPTHTPPPPSTPILSINTTATTTPTTPCSLSACV